MNNNITQLTRTPLTGGLLSALLGFTLLAAAGSPAFADDGNVGNRNIVPPQSHPYGLSYAEWAERFWKWAQAFPSTATPLNGSAPQESAQSGPVWFLDSSGYKPDRNPATTPHRVTIPAGKSLFVPVLGYFNNNAACPVNTTFTEEELLAQANDVYGALASRTECFIDGVRVKGLGNPRTTAYRLQTGLFLVTVANHDNVFAGDCVPNGGTIDEVAVGAYLMIRPLNVGQHTVRVIGAIKPAPGVVLTKDDTYNITVTGR